MKVSIIVPVYNSQKYISECINSIKKQKFEDWELILINDGSTDLSREICEEFTKEDQRIRLINQPNRGVSNARNRGIEESKGDFLFFVDSDDYIHPSLLELLYKEALVNNADIVRFGFKVTNDRNLNSKPLDKIEIFEGKDDVGLFFLKKRIESVWSSLYSKKIIGDNRFSSLKTSEDLEFNNRVYGQAEKVIYNRSKLYYYYYNEESLSKGEYNDNKLSYIQVRKHILEEYILEQKKKHISISKSLLVRAYMASLLRITRYGISEKMNEKQIVKEYRKYLRRNMFRMIFSKYIPISRKISIIPIMINYKLSKKIFRVK